MAKAKKYRVGLIGCGGIAGRHFGDLAGEKRADLVALCDPDPKRISGWKEQRPELAKAAEYADYKKMLKNENLDAVYIASPHKFHYKQIMDSMKAGCHVVTEKPMVCSITDARKVCAASKKMKKAVVLAYQRRFQAHYRKTRELVDKGKLGKLLSVSAFQSQNWLRSQNGTWRQNLDLSCGGQLNDSGSHLVDILLYMINDIPKEVFCFSDNRKTEVDIDSTVCARFQKGALLSMLIAGSACNFREDIIFCFEKASLTIAHGKLILVQEGSPPEEVPCKALNMTPTKNLFDHIQKGTDILVGPEAGLRVMQLTEPAWKAAETGLPQKVRM